MDGLSRKGLLVRGVQSDRVWHHLRLTHRRRQVMDRAGFQLRRIMLHRGLGEALLIFRLAL